MTPRSGDSLEALFQRYRGREDASALAEIYDHCAPGLLRLAWRLAGPRRRDWAEDALQETFLALVERPERFDASQPLLPWLTSILVRRLRDLERKEARRPSPEHVAQNRDETLTLDPAEELTGGELRSEVDRAVEALPESLRLVVEGKLKGTSATHELARELGISPGSFRVRLHRALARLRDRIPQSLLGLVALFSSRERALAATRTQMLEASGLTLPSAVLPLTFGAILMTKKIALALVALLIGSASWFALRTSGPEPARVNEAHEAQTIAENLTRPEATSSELSLVPTISSGRVAEPTSEPSRAVLLVSATRLGTGEALVNQKVTMLYHKGDPLKPSETRTDAQGIARFEVEPNRKITSLRLLPGDDHCGANFRELLELDPGAERTVILQAGRGTSIRGRVVDRSGNAVPHAEVVAWCSRSDWFAPDHRVLADADGAFLVEGLGTGFVMKASTTDLAADRGLRGEVHEGDAFEGLILVVHDRSNLSGRVVNEIGLPVEGAEITLHSGLRSRTSSDATGAAGVLGFQCGRGQAVSDGEGRFSIEGLPDSRGRSGFFSHQLRIAHSKYDVHSGHAEGGGGMEREYVLLAPLTMLGQVYDRNGKPASGALIRGVPQVESTSKQEDTLRADDEGRFVLRGLRNSNRRAKHEYALQVIYEGHAVRRVEGFDPRDWSSKPFVIRLDEAERTIEGRVVDEAGRPISGVALDIEGTRICSGSRAIPPRTWERMSGLAEQETDSEGRFQFTHLYPGTFKLRAVDPRDDDRVYREPIATGSRALEIVMSDENVAPVILRGTVRAAQGGAKIDQFTVSAVGAGRGPRFEFTEAGGAYELSLSEPERYRVTIDAPGFAPRQLPEKWLSRGDNVLSCELQPARSLTVQLAGENVTESIYQIAPLDLFGEEVLFQSAYSASSRSIETAQGRAQLHRLPAQVIVLRVSNQNHSQEFEIDLTEPIESPLTLELGPLPGARVWLKLTENGAKPISSFHLVFEGADQSKLAMVFSRTDPPGVTGVMQRFAYQHLGNVEDPSVPFSIRLPEGESVLRLHAGAAAGRILEIAAGRYTEQMPLEIDLGGL